MPILKHPNGDEQINLGSGKQSSRATHKNLQMERFVICHEKQVKMNLLNVIAML